MLGLSAARDRRSLEWYQRRLGAALALAAIVIVMAGCAGRSTGDDQPRGQRSLGRPAPGAVYRTRAKVRETSTARLANPTRRPKTAANAYALAQAHGDAITMCSLLSPKGVRHLLFIVRNADYALPPHAGCLDAAKAYPRAVGPGFPPKIATAMKTITLRPKGGFARATFYASGIKIPQHIVARKTSLGWKIDRVPGAWAERPLANE